MLGEKKKEMAVCHSGVLGQPRECLVSVPDTWLPIQLLVTVHLRERQQVLALDLYCCHHKGYSDEFWAPGPGLAVLGIWGVDQWIRLSVFQIK